MKKTKTKKNIVLIIAGILLIAGAAVLGVGLYIHSTPEYTLGKTIQDTKKDGIDGLKRYLTDDACQKVEQVMEWAENPVITGALSSVSSNEELLFLKDEISEIDWDVKDVLRGKQEADVVIGFQYRDQVAGTVRIMMVRRRDGWKINSIGIPEFEKFF